MISVAKIWQTPALFPQWLSNLWSHSAHRATALPATSQPAPLAPALRSTLIIEQIPVPSQSATAHLQLVGTVDRYTYIALIDQTVMLYRQGYRALLLDLRQTTRLELSGFFALLSIARLYSGASLLDPEEGWVGLRRAVEESTPALGQRITLIATEPMTQIIRKISFCDVFAIYADAARAIAVFAH